MQRNLPRDSAVVPRDKRDAESGLQRHDGENRKSRGLLLCSASKHSQLVQYHLESGEAGWVKGSEGRITKQDEDSI